MSCALGRATPDKPTERRLWASSAGFCQNPDCLQTLFFDVATTARSTSIAEVAHVIAASDSGPRGGPELSAAARASYSNLIILCPTCHTKIDKAATDYPATRLHEWKQRHSDRIASTLGAVRCQTRPEARGAIAGLLEENYTIFREFGPYSDYRFDPESGVAAVWRRKVVERILPNSRRILATLDVNHDLLTHTERQTLELFRQHVDDLEARHLRGEHADSTTFPRGIATILSDAGDG